MTDFARSNPLEVPRPAAGTGFVTKSACIQCQQPGNPPRKRGKAMIGSLRGMIGLLCHGCRMVNAGKAAEMATVRDAVA